MSKIIQLLKETEINFLDLKRQIDRDVSLSGIEDQNFYLISSEVEFLAFFNRFIEELISHYPELFSNFMYRVDVPESKLTNLNRKEVGSLVEHLSYLIIKREMQKVYFRKKYSL